MVTPLSAEQLWMRAAGTLECCCKSVFNLTDSKLACSSSPLVSASDHSQLRDLNFGDEFIMGLTNIIVELFKHTSA